jgi:hypothetical protein
LKPSDNVVVSKLIIDTISTTFDLYNIYMACRIKNGSLCKFVSDNNFDNSFLMFL